MREEGREGGDEGKGRERGRGRMEQRELVPLSFRTWLCPWIKAMVHFR